MSRARPRSGLRERRRRWRRNRKKKGISRIKSREMVVDMAKSTIETPLRMELDLVWIVRGCKVNGFVVKDVFRTRPISSGVKCTSSYHFYY